MKLIIMLIGLAMVWLGFFFQPCNFWGNLFNPMCIVFALSRVPLVIIGFIVFLKGVFTKNVK